MENIAKVRMKRTLKTGRTSATKLFEEGAVYEAPFPRILREEYARRPQTFEVLAMKQTEPPPQKPETKEPETKEPEKKKAASKKKKAAPKKPKLNTEVSK
ncbi:MAG: hypothetical protein ACWGQW_02430 [bacterium]